MTTTAAKPKVNSAGERELDKCAEEFKVFDAQVKEMTMDRMNLVPRIESEGQTKIAQSDLAKAKEFILKPSNFIASREKFNEKFRKEYDYDKQYISFIAENIEIRGEIIELWCKPYPGCPAEFYKVPVNIVLSGPRYVYEQLKRKFHHKLTMQESSYTGGDHTGQYYGKMAVDTTVQRLDARMVDSRKSISMVTV